MPRCPAEQPETNSIFFLGGLNFAGVVKRGLSEKLFFFRAEAATLWKELDLFKSDVAEKKGLRVLGSPGVGKSLEVWAWLCCQSLNYAGGEDKVFALWVHIFKTCMYAA